MDPLNAAIALLITDAADTSAKQAAQADANAKAVAAAQDASAASDALTVAVAKQNADVAAAVALIQSTYLIPTTPAEPTVMSAMAAPRAAAVAPSVQAIGDGAILKQILALAPQVIALLVQLGILKVPATA